MDFFRRLFGRSNSKQTAQRSTKIVDPGKGTELDAGWTNDLVNAAQTGDIRLVKELIPKVSDIDGYRDDSTGISALHWAATSGHFGIFMELLNAGARIEAAHSPLSGAAQSGSLEIVEEILARGSYSAVADSLEEALMAAVQSRHERIVARILAAGVDVNVARFDSTTALHMAARKGDSVIGEMLIKSGAVVEAKLSNGSTPWILARESRHDDFCQLLERYGARKYEGEHDRPQSDYCNSAPSNPPSITERSGEPGVTIRTSFPVTPEGTPEQFYAKMSRDLVDLHGPLVRVEYLEHYPSFRIRFTYEDGAVIHSEKPTGGADVHSLTLGYIGEGPRWARAFLSAAGIELSMDEIRNIKPGDVLTPESRNEDCSAKPGQSTIEAHDVARDRWLERNLARAEMGNAVAQFNLGVMYSEGRNVPRDEVEAVRWFRMAAEQGDAEAQVQLAFRYREGLGIQRDDERSVHWNRKAAEQGHPIAQQNLGTMYAAGQGVTKDVNEARIWWKRAAEQGNEEAEALLALSTVKRGAVLKHPQKQEIEKHCQIVMAEVTSQLMKEADSGEVDFNEQYLRRTIARLRSDCGLSAEEAVTILQEVSEKG